MVQRQYRRQYGGTPPDSKTIKAWYDKFKDTGSVADRRRTGRPRISEQNVEALRAAFQRSPGKSIRRASLQLDIPRSSVHKVLHKCLHLHAYKVQIVQALLPNDLPRRAEFAIEILDRIDGNNDYLKRICFSDEATFHISGRVNRQNVRIWGSEKPHVIREHVRDSPKVNVWCGLMHSRIIGPFFFAESTVTANVYLDMLEQFATPQLQDLQPDVIFQQDGAPPHWGINVRNFLDTTFPGRWIGRDGPTCWLPRSLDITSLDFFLWGYVKDKVYATSIEDLDTLKQRISEVIASVTPDMLANTWREIEYRLDVLRATNGAHVEVY